MPSLHVGTKGGVNREQHFRAVKKRKMRRPTRTCRAGLLHWDDDICRYSATPARSAIAFAARAEMSLRTSSVITVESAIIPLGLRNKP